MRAPSLQDVLQVRSSSAVYGAVALHLNVMMYACSFWLTQPLLPYMTARLGVDRITFGYLQSALEVAQIISRLHDSVAAVVTNAVLIGPLQRRFRPQQLILASISALALCFAILTFTRTYQELLVLLVPVSIASTVLYTITAASLSNSVDSDETGTAVSISHSIRSFTGVVAPPIGGTLFTYARLDGVGFASSGLAAIAAFVYMLLTNATVAAAQGAGDHEPAARAHDKKTS
ncbi:hypothetical protein PTSG_12857 [Salpingoeca rosetta]|uniref:Major facilitator superfamily (MFS) profile domain-containing protein n=1 Tax=Salpingoeca rosetta (strain ATCC 50818 / BSB-021) TaxID=946362 RepID=F2UN64_SALR5|nr:uncharacterized protein PTSG_12857 [Salpingoeca rosetta]EGD78563.1 hypothetical protein PTSG_12857 [Salpingoeca rosetta]|eukprot:XP_004989512.1 hypothetical protein PTSG_12857 [Salpingoeca rosetta]